MLTSRDNEKNQCYFLHINQKKTYAIMPYGENETDATRPRRQTVTNAILHFTGEQFNGKSPAGYDLQECDGLSVSEIIPSLKWQQKNRPSKEGHTVEAFKYVLKYVLKSKYI